MAYKNKTYICFDGDNDMHYYRLMTAWSANENCSFSLYNAHDLNTARDSSQEESIKRQLRERLNNSKLFIVLIGENTRYLTKFVAWEMQVAISLKLPIIGVNLNGSRARDHLCPPTIRDEIAIYIPFNMDIIEYAMIHWPASHDRYHAERKVNYYHYLDSVYQKLGFR